MLRALILVTCLAALSAAAPWDYWGYNQHNAGNLGYGGFPWGGWFPWSFPYHGYPSYNQGYQGYPAQAGGYAPYNRLVFYGEFKGTCDKAQDGIYFVDERSFAFCSNGQKTIQPCAEGSANPPASHFKHGNYYALYDFCSINLVAKGYTGPKYDAKPSKVAYGYPEAPAPKYEETHEYYHESSYVSPKPAEYGKPPKH